MTNDEREVQIATPVARRARQLRQRYLPVAVWLMAVATALMVAQQRRSYVEAVGMVEVRQVAVAPVMDGTVRSISVDRFDFVQEGQVVALMDDTLERGELLVAEAELAQLRAAFEAERNRVDVEAALTAADTRDDRRRFVLNDEEARLDLLDRMVEQETDRAALQRLDVQLQRQEGLVRQKLASAADLDEARLQHEEVKTRLAENEAALALARQRAQDAATRLAQWRDEADAELDPDLFLASIREGLTVQEALIQEVKERRAMLALRAPLSGQVNQIFRRVAETVLSGDPILTIADAASQRVVAYVDEYDADAIAVGMPVEVSSRRHPGEAVAARVVKVGAQIESLPLHLQRSPLFEQRGLPILVAEAQTDRFIPGETLDLRFQIGAVEKAERR